MNNYDTISLLIALTTVTSEDVKQPIYEELKRRTKLRIL
jgi:hypothetical protein